MGNTWILLMMLALPTGGMQAKQANEFSTLTQCAYIGRQAVLDIRSRNEAPVVGFACVLKPPPGAEDKDDE